MLSLQSFLPLNSLAEKQIIEEIRRQNNKINPKLNSHQKLLLHELRAASSDSIKNDPSKMIPWTNALLYAEDKEIDSLFLKEKIIHLNFLLTGNRGFRELPVTAGFSEFPDSKDLDSIHTEFLNLVKAIDCKISQAAFTYQVICSVHFFLDGNARVARLLCDKILISDEINPLIFANPALGFVIPSFDEKEFHLKALEKILVSVNWGADLF